MAKTINYFPKEEKVFIVIYSTDRMREREFDNEAEANKFAATVNGGVCPMTRKILPSLTAAQSRKINKETKRIKKFGYGT